jgi:hypothetical protein
MSNSDDHRSNSMATGERGSAAAPALYDSGEDGVEKSVFPSMTVSRLRAASRMGSQAFMQWDQRMMGDKGQDGSPEGEGGEGRPDFRTKDQRRKAKRAGKRYIGHMTPFWITYECVLCALMVAGVGVLLYYSLALCPKAAPRDRHYSVYDSLEAPAHPLLLKRDESLYASMLQQQQAAAALSSLPSATSNGTTSAGTSSNTTTTARSTSSNTAGLSTTSVGSIPRPASEMRWQMPADTRGLDQIADLHVAMMHMADTSVSAVWASLVTMKNDQRLWSGLLATFC